MFDRQPGALGSETPVLVFKSEVTLDRALELSFDAISLTLFTFCLKIRRFPDFFMPLWHI